MHADRTRSTSRPVAVVLKLGLASLVTVLLVAPGTTPSAASSLSVAPGELAIPAVTMRPPAPSSVAAGAAASAELRPQSDPRAVEIARSVMEAMGGQEAWNDTRYISWKFMGGRQHYWDKWTGNHRIEMDERDGGHLVMLFNINTTEGRFWRDGEEITDPAEVEQLEERARRSWINDTYWMFMPYKLLDPGVTLRYMGEDTLPDGGTADVLQLTFEEVGVTPDNRYLVYVARDSGLVEQWSYFQSRDDEEPGFTLPWAGWERFGEIMLATSKGRDADWDIHVYDELPESVFTSPGPVTIR